MAAVAQNTVAGMFAAAKIHGPALLGLVFDRREPGALMGAVTEWLPFALAAGAPPITLAGFDFDCTRGLLWDGGFAHGSIPYCLNASMEISMVTVSPT